MATARSRSDVSFVGLSPFLVFVDLSFELENRKKKITKSVEYKNGKKAIIFIV